MGQQTQPRKPTGLYKRGKYWYIDKDVSGKRISGPTGTTKIKEAEAILNQKIAEARKAIHFGVRPRRTFQEAVNKYIKEEELNGKASLDTEIGYIDTLLPFIGQMPLDSIHNDTLAKYKETRKKEPYLAGCAKKGKTKKRRKNQTINYGLKLVSQILKRAATDWRDDNNLTWLAEAPKIKLLPENDKRQPYPISWEEQETLFSALPAHLKRMALFAVNTGCRDSEICSLKWEWEKRIPGLDTSVFIIPGFVMEQLAASASETEDADELEEVNIVGIDQVQRQTKNGEDRLIVLNKVATDIVESVRGVHSEYVFSYRGRRLYRMNNTGWQTARKNVGLRQVRVHDLRHTFGRRLRAADVSFEDRQDLLGHKSGRVTTHYSAAEIGNLIAAVNRVCEHNDSSPTLTLLRSTA